MRAIMRWFSLSRLAGLASRSQTLGPAEVGLVGRAIWSSLENNRRRKRDNLEPSRVANTLDNLFRGPMPRADAANLKFWLLAFVEGPSIDVRARALAALQQIPCKTSVCPVGLVSERPDERVVMPEHLALCVIVHDPGPGVWPLPGADSPFASCAAEALGVTATDPVELHLVGPDGPWGWKIADKDPDLGEARSVPTPHSDRP